MEKKYGRKSTGKKVRKQKVRPDRASSGHVNLSIPVKKAPLGRILRNFRLCMCMHNILPNKATSGHFLSLPVKHAHGITSGSSSTIAPPQIWLELCPYMKIFHFKFNGIDEINEITKPRII